MMAYSSFVTSRFKTFPDLGQTLIHATVGMVGEAIEVLYAPDRESLLKELGDFEFYFEAFQQAVPGPQWAFIGIEGFGPNHFTNLADSLIAWSGDCLDLAKKLWVYEMPVENLNFDSYIPGIRHALDALYEQLGTTYDEVTKINMEKLLKRYPNGYSNAAAQARADGEGERHGN